jgi:hypothetical protein
MEKGNEAGVRPGTTHHNSRGGGSEGARKAVGGRGAAAPGSSEGERC